MLAVPLELDDDGCLPPADRVIATRLQGPPKRPKCKVPHRNPTTQEVRNEMKNALAVYDEYHRQRDPYYEKFGITQQCADEQWRALGYEEGAPDIRDPRELWKDEAEERLREERKRKRDDVEASPHQLKRAKKGEDEDEADADTGYLFDNKKRFAYLRKHCQFRPFDARKQLFIGKNFDFVLVFGSPNSGKTVLQRDLLNVNADKFARVIVFTETGELNGDYECMVPARAIRKFSEEALWRVIRKQEEYVKWQRAMMEAGHGCPNVHLCILMTDCAGNVSWANSRAFRHLQANHRQMQTSVLADAQYVKMSAKSGRETADKMIFFAEKRGGLREMMLEYLGFTNDRAAARLFLQLFDQHTRDHGCVVMEWRQLDHTEEQMQNLFADIYAYRATMWEDDELHQLGTAEFWAEFGEEIEDENELVAREDADQGEEESELEQMMALDPEQFTGGTVYTTGMFDDVDVE